MVLKFSTPAGGSEQTLLNPTNENSALVFVPSPGVVQDAKNITPRITTGIRISGKELEVLGFFGPHSLFDFLLFRRARLPPSREVAVFTIFVFLFAG